jgi:hypothetical protein
MAVRYHLLRAKTIAPEEFLHRLPTAMAFLQAAAA